MANNDKKEEKVEPKLLEQPATILDNSTSIDNIGVLNSNKLSFTKAEFYLKLNEYRTKLDGFDFSTKLKVKDVLVRYYKFLKYFKILMLAHNTYKEALHFKVSENEIKEMVYDSNVLKTPITDIANLTTLSITNPVLRLLLEIKDSFKIDKLKVYEAYQNAPTLKEVKEVCDLIDADLFVLMLMKANIFGSEDDELDSSIKKYLIDEKLNAKKDVESIKSKSWNKVSYNYELISNETMLNEIVAKTKEIALNDKLMLTSTSLSDANSLLAESHLVWDKTINKDDLYVIKVSAIDKNRNTVWTWYKSIFIAQSLYALHVLPYLIDEDIVIKKECEC